MDGSDLRVTTELEDLSASFDYQNGHFKAQSKVGNLSITHCRIGYVVSIVVTGIGDCQGKVRMVVDSRERWIDS